MNWYNYVGSDPVNFVDPLGLNCQDFPGGWQKFRDSNGNGKWDEGEEVIEIGVCGGGGGSRGGGGGLRGGGGGGGAVPSPGEGGGPQKEETDNCNLAQEIGQKVGKFTTEVGGLTTNLGLIGLTGAEIVGMYGARRMSPTAFLVAGAIAAPSAKLTAYGGGITTGGSVISLASGAGKPATVDLISRVTTHMVPDGIVKEYASLAIGKVADAAIPEWAYQCNVK